MVLSGSNRRESLQDQVDATLANLFSTETPWTELGLPELIEIEPTNYCNLKCVMCHVSYEDLRRERIDVRRLLRSLKGLNGKWLLIGSAYEPLTHPQFPFLVQGLSDLGMKIDLTTNATLLTRKTIDEVKGASFRIVTVSFDGVRKQTYEGIRRGAKYDLTIERIRNLKGAIEVEDCFFQANYTVMRSNIAEISHAVDFWENLGFDHLGFIMMVIRDDNDFLRRESPYSVEADVIEQVEATGRKIIENDLALVTSSAYFNRTNLAREYPDNFFWPHCVISHNPRSRLLVNPRPQIQNGSFPGMAVGCRSPFKLARIMWNGDVQLCMQFIVGNILKNNLIDIWFGKAAERIRKLVLSRPEICYSCDYYRFCLNAGLVDTGNAENTVNAAVGNRLLEFLEPTLVTSCPEVGYNIVGWLGEYYAVPQSLGPIKLTEEDVSGLPGVVISSSLDALGKELTSLLQRPILLKTVELQPWPRKWAFGSITSRLKALLKPR